MHLVIFVFAISVLAISVFAISVFAISVLVISVSTFFDRLLFSTVKGYIFRFCLFININMFNIVLL